MSTIPLRFSVPEPLKPYLRLLQAIPAKDLDALTQAIDAAGPQAYVPQLAQRVTDAGPYDLESTLGILSVAVSLLQTRERSGEGIPALIDRVIETVATDEDLKPDVDGQARLRTALEKLLASDVVQLTMKAGGLLLEFDRVFAEARIITDFRPVYAPSDDRIAAGIVVHTLRIEWLRGESPVYVTLDDADLEQLEQQIVRARNKASLLRDTIGRVGVPIVSPGVSE